MLMLSKNKAPIQQLKPLYTLTVQTSSIARNRSIASLNAHRCNQLKVSCRNDTKLFEKSDGTVEYIPT